MSSDLKRSPLEAAHLKLGARLVPFAGWNMPVQYTSILEEHESVRTGTGIFDISHMGQFFVSGPGAAAWLNRMLTNDITRLAPGQGQYTLMLNEQGGVIDDLLAYRTGDDEYLLVVNASMIDEDFFWLAGHQDEQVVLRNESDLWAGMAVQGPLAVEIFAKVCPGVSLPVRNGVATIADGVIVCRTGYTGEDGFELFCPAAEGIAWWERFLAAGAAPCGLGARDTLRLEMSYPLNGNDLSPERTPIEAGLGYFCAMEKGDFIGRETLARQKAEGTDVMHCCMLCIEKGPPPRAHYPVVDRDGQQLGEITSGAVTPLFKTGVAMAYLPASYDHPGLRVYIDIRGRRYPAVIVEKPFRKRRY